MNIGQLYLSFRGRINRKTYWLAVLPFIVGYAVANVLTESTDESTAGLGVIMFLVMLWPSLAVQTKRWHDRNKSGWWNLIGLVPIVGPFWSFIELGFCRGTAGTNKYGFTPDTRPSDEPEVPAVRPVNPYMAQEEKERELIGSGVSRSNSWRGV